MKKTTSFGTMQTLLDRDGKIISELITFNKTGRVHRHTIWEHCYVLEGSGIIINGNKEIQVEKGSFCKIPPNTDHWMIPDPFLEILIVYSENI